jgi:predicted HicB family RNase H-like nuclease
MKDKNLDANRHRINPDLWRKMRISALSQGKLIFQWLEEAIKMKLNAEAKDNEN